MSWDLWSAADGGTIHNPTWLTRNHRTGQLIAGEYQGDHLLVFTPDDGIDFMAPQNMVYDGSDKAFSASAPVPCTFAYIYTGTGITSYGPSTEAPRGAGNYVVTARSTDLIHVGSSTVPFVISPKSLTITATGANKNYGNSDPALFYQSAGLVGEDGISGNLARVPGENVGRYSILPGTLAASGNYAIHFVGADLIIDPVPIAPTNFVASQTTSRAVDLAWTADISGNSACTGYKISHRISGTSEWTEASVGSSAAAFQMPDVEPGTLYEFRIAALNGVESSSHAATSLTSWTDLEEWRFANFGTTGNSGNAADHANPSSDGLVNLVKYALGLNASARIGSSHLDTQMNADRRLTLTFQRARDDLDYIVQGSSDLSTWTDIALNPGTVGTAVTVTDTAPADAARRFLRLKVAR